MNGLKGIITCLIATGVFFIAHSTSVDFKTNQVGYYPSANKIVPVVGTHDTTFDLLNMNDSIVFHGSLSKQKYWSRSGDSVRQADFSSFAQEGTYRLSVSDRGTSLPLRISDNALYNISYASLKTFYYQRCSFALDTQYAGIFARAAGHPDTSCIFHSSSGKAADAAHRSSTGGWYDAGDYGKYVVNAGITVGTMLGFYEVFGSFFGDSALNIPESHNGIDDLLDEIKFELDWLKTMQDDDGGVFHKLTTLRHAGFVMPEKDNADRYFIGKSASASLNFAAVMAMASRVYGAIDTFKTFADSCSVMAESAWVWATAHPDSLFLANPSGTGTGYSGAVGTGTYEDDNINDEFLWAAAELFITTGKQIYKDTLSARNISYSANPPSWQVVSDLAALSLSAIPNELGTPKIDSIKNSVLTQANNFFNQIQSGAFRIPGAGWFYWGSNGVFAQAGICLVYAYHFTDNIKYIKAAAEIADYLLGKNATPYSFVTGFGASCSMSPHHRPSVADGFEPSIPGFLVGGPNPTPKDYSDSYSNYTTNEVAINWNAPSTVLFAAVQKFLGDSNSDSPKSNTFTLTVDVSGAGSVEISPKSTFYEAGQVCTLTIKNTEDNYFLGWSGAASGFSNPLIFTISKDSRLVATFDTPGELIANGTFTDETNHWSILKNGGATGSASVVDGLLKIEITKQGLSGGTVLDYGIQLVQTDITLVQGVTYVFSFDAHSDSNRTIVADVAKGYSPWSSYTGSMNKSISLTKEIQTFTRTFTMDSLSDTKARITFNCGSSMSPVYIDNISLHDVKFVPAPAQKPHTNKLYGNQALKLYTQNSLTRISLILHKPQAADLKIFDSRGCLVMNLSKTIQNLSEGKQEIIIRKRFVPGVYFVRLGNGGQVMTKNLTILR